MGANADSGGSTKMETGATWIVGAKVGDLPKIPSLIWVAGLVEFCFEDLGTKLQKLSE